MSSSKTVKDARWTFRADLRIESDKLAENEAWLSKRLRNQSKTALCTEALELLKRYDDSGGIVLSDELHSLIEEYRNALTVKPSPTEILKTAMTILIEHDKKN